jgi:hypothetical protein
MFENNWIKNTSMEVYNESAWMSGFDTAMNKKSFNWKVEIIKPKYKVFCCMLVDYN